MILLTVQESDNQLISGIPEFVTVESSVPATIFFTLDGTDPDQNSEIFVDKIYLTYSNSSVTLKLKALGIDDESGIVEMTWSTKIPKLDKVALTGKEGINILPSGKAIVDFLAIDTSGEPQRATSIKFSNLDIKTNKTDRIGQKIAEESSIPFIKFPKVIHDSKNLESISATDQINFDPTAKMILIDGYAGFDKQEVKVINRPQGTMRPTSKFYDQKVHYDNMVSGDFVRYMYNPKTKKIVLYYRESLDGRWITSTQKVEASTLDLTPSGNPFVFRWVMDRAQTRLF